jgi:hypothetical protein
MYCKVLPCTLKYCNIALYCTCSTGDLLHRTDDVPSVARSPLLLPVHNQYILAHVYFQFLFSFMIQLEICSPEKETGLKFRL